jgi:hypothetical protein
VAAGALGALGIAQRWVGVSAGTTISGKNNGSNGSTAVHLIPPCHQPCPGSALLYGEHRLGFGGNPGTYRNINPVQPISAVELDYFAIACYFDCAGEPTAVVAGWDTSRPQVAQSTLVPPPPEAVGMGSGSSAHPAWDHFRRCDSAPIGICLPNLHPEWG